MGDAVSSIDNSPLFRMLTDMVMEGPSMLMRAVSRTAATVTESVTAGVSALKEGIGNIASSSGQSIHESAAEVAPKLGRSANFHMYGVEADASAYAANHNDIRVPTVGAKSAQQGAGINA